MQLKFIKCDWGMEHLGEMPERLKAYAAAGYDGVECANIGMAPDAFGEATEALGLDYVAMMFCDDEDAFAKQLAFVKKTRPILINCHPGRDYFDLDRSVRFFNDVAEQAAAVDAPVVFETHRTRCLYSPWQTERILNALPWLRITADFSHFTNVAENDLRQPPYSNMMDIAIERTDHIHARVGSSESPQVADPRVGVGLKWAGLFEQWWDRVIEARMAEGKPYLTINAEVGPPPYQPVDPSNDSPLADIWDVCLWTNDRFRERWSGKCEMSSR
ncbi:MAG: TIM barrel protein [Pseudomonadales bacterium]|nr:TIM barrel protein [Pseudomonadales bacterium]